MGIGVIYVLDNNIFSYSFKHVSLDVFDDIWGSWSTLIRKGVIISVDEVLCELNQRWDEESAEGVWLKEHKMCFQKTTNIEGFIVADIFKNKKFREGIKEASLRNGSPEADALLVAKAKSVGGVVVTGESDQKPNSEKIPNIAVTFGVPYMKLNDFYKMLRNLHLGRAEHHQVEIYYTLGQATQLG